jgi:uncharacterized protein YtpQ (UPF0354 family)
MWLWVVLAWCVVAGTLATIHHRVRRLQPDVQPEVAAFLLRFETALAERHPDVHFLGMLPGRFACLLRVRGQETPVSLHDIYRQVEAWPDSFDGAVASLVRDIVEIGLDRVEDFDFATAAPLLLPQIRSRAWLDEQGRFGDSGLVHRVLNDELVVVYVVDDSHTMVFVCRAHVRLWQRTEADIHQLACANLARRGDGGMRQPAQEPVRLHSGDGYDAARVLLLGHEAESEGLLVAIPERDTLWVGTPEGQNLAALMATTEAIAGQSPHPVSARVWQLKDGQLAPLPESR